MDDGLVAKSKGEVVEGYRILSEIGRGAASIIYLCQEEKTKRVYALKHVQKRTEKDKRFLDQAEIEYNIARALDHPVIRKIPRIIKKGTILKTRELWLVMELVDGVSMDRHPPATFESAIEQFLQVAGGLGHMHERGFVHADMKPNNVIVSDSGQARIIDLGQGCRIGTIKPRIQGTPDYIAPEQVHRREIVPQTDVYNFGAMMYWVLTRKNIPTALAKGDSLVGSLDGSMIQRPQPPVEVNRRVPPRLSDLIMECVEPAVEKRPAGMLAVVGRLELILGQLRAAAAAKRGDAMVDPDGDTRISAPGNG